MKHLFLPHGSPDYNPTKQAISTIRANITLAHESLGEAERKEEVEAILHHHVFNITKEQTHGWFRECGYA
jgi:transposase